MSGQMIGTILGGIAGTFFDAPEIGAQLGGMLGNAISGSGSSSSSNMGQVQQPSVSPNMGQVSQILPQYVGSGEGYGNVVNGISSYAQPQPNLSQQLPMYLQGQNGNQIINTGMNALGAFGILPTMNNGGGGGGYQSAPYEYQTSGSGGGGGEIEDILGEDME